MLLSLSSSTMAGVLQLGMMLLVLCLTGGREGWTNCGFQMMMVLSMSINGVGS